MAHLTGVSQTEVRHTYIGSKRTPIGGMAHLTGVSQTEVRQVVKVVALIQIFSL